MSDLTNTDPEAKFLALREPPPSEAVVGLLEVLLAQARSGHIRALAFATVNAGRSVGTGYSIEERGVEAHALIGGLERVKLRVLSLDEVG